MDPLIKISSFVMCIGLALTYLVLPNSNSTDVYSSAAVGAGLAICAGILVESRAGLRSLIRTDLLLIVTLFGLTLVEFFFPQGHIDSLVGPQTAIQGVEALFLGFCGIIIGRIPTHRYERDRTHQVVVQLGQKTLFRLYLLVFFLGYLYMLFMVGFNPVELVSQMLLPRFHQVWTRGQFGGISDIFGEFCGLLLYLVPALGGAILADRERFTFVQLACVTFGLVFTLFYGFSSGTRNVFAIYVVIFAAAYLILRRNVAWKGTAIGATAVAVILYFGAYYMLQLRGVGLARYLEGGATSVGFRKETLFIDNNLPVISLLTDIFPARYDYLGFEIPVYAIAHPIPRAIWPDKPAGLSVETADALGVRGASIASTFVGEAYITGGYPAIIVISLMFGIFAGWWNRIRYRLHSNVGVAVYASGFFAAMLCMRSMVWFTTAMLPTFAIWLYVRKMSGRDSQRALPSRRSSNL